MSRYHWRYLLMLLLCSLVSREFVVCREIESSRSEAAGTGEEDTLTAQSLSEGLRLVCSYTKDAFRDDIAPIQADGEIRARYSEFVEEIRNSEEHELFLPKPIRSKYLSLYYINSYC